MRPTNPIQKDSRLVSSRGNSNRGGKRCRGGSSGRGGSKGMTPSDSSPVSGSRLSKGSPLSPASVSNIGIRQKRIRSSSSLCLSVSG